MNRKGEQKISKFGIIMTIIEYNNANDIIVEFENGYKVNTQYRHFQKDEIKNPYDKRTYDVGYIGEGNYKASINNKNTIQYKYWNHMLRRCYSDKFQEKHPTYIGCEVCEEWHCFQTFAKWFDENYYVINDERIELDKDILYKDNKVYSPETCVFVPSRINSLFVKCNATRGGLPIGVTLLSNGKFKSTCSVYNILSKKYENKHLGCFNTSKNAFYKGYKPFKEVYIKEVANDYKDKIPKKLYDAIYNYVVEIDD